ncbi:MAG: protein kinase [Labilithrix sp.]|nr:protein kinase [Labilithrix sp.]MCW5810310.1 protein kinase [Labilithrix sp.]
MGIDEPRGRVGQLIAGKWQIDQRIGVGGMATVYAATHRTNGMRAAIKMLHAPLSRDASTRARFLREGYVANSVGHDGVVAVLDDGVAEDGAAFLVLELLEGETIDARRHRLGGSIPIEEALEVGVQALDALASAHEKGIVHRDVKPENVFLTNEGRVKLLDFGLAHMRDVQAEATKTGVTIGTPEFMPPEQAQGRRDVDARSDVWGVGATLFTIISGAFVHDDAQTIHEALIASATRRPRPLRELVPHLSPAIAQVIDRALELEMSDRWESAAHMRDALLAAQKPSGGKVYDSETALAMPTSRRRPDVVLVSDDTMQDSQPVDVRSGEVELAPTYADTTRRRKAKRREREERERVPPPAGTTRMANRPSRPAASPQGQFRAPMQTPSEEHETFAAPASMPPRSSPGSMPPRASMAPIHDPMEPTPIVNLHAHGHPSIPPEYMPQEHLPTDPSLRLVPQERPRQKESKETMILLGLALFFLCAAAGAFMMRSRR